MTNTQNETQYRLEAALAWHLAHNFIPPQPAELLEYCLEAVDACRAGDDGRVLSLPGMTITAGQLIEDLRLNDLVEA